MKNEPCFDNLLKIIRCEKPSRPTLFEFFLNTKLYEVLSDMKMGNLDFSYNYEVAIPAFANAGYDYATLRGSDFKFPKGDHSLLKTLSANSGAIINSKKDFLNYVCPNPADCDYSILEKCSKTLPLGMKIIVWGPGGVLENVIDLVGYDNLCFMLVEDPEFADDIFNFVGTRLVEYYKICAGYDSVGALISNDDWGFSSQTLLSPNDLRKYVFPYHKEIVKVIHSFNKPAILHSCGNLSEVMDDIIDDIKYDAKHSFEDKILPVEDAYAKYHPRIAILGGIDLDFVCRSTPEAIKLRCEKMIEQTDGCKGYAIGTGNSVPDYVPFENYFAMIDSCRKFGMPK